MTPNMNETVKRMEERMDRIENGLDTILNNHLKHIERYTRWTLIGILVSSAASITALVYSFYGF